MKIKASKASLRVFSRQLRWCYARSTLSGFLILAGAIFSPFAVFCFIAVNLSPFIGWLSLCVAFFCAFLCGMCIVNLWKKGWFESVFSNHWSVQCPCCGHSKIKIRIVYGFTPRRTAVCLCPNCGFSHSIVIN